MTEAASKAGVIDANKFSFYLQSNEKPYVPYSDLSITSYPWGRFGEIAEHLLNERKRGCLNENAYGTCKFLTWFEKDQGPSDVKLEITSNRPIKLTAFALRSANDSPERDPKHWTLTAIDSDNNEHLLKRMDNDESKWGGRRWSHIPVE